MGLNTISEKIKRKLHQALQGSADTYHTATIRFLNKWPCTDKKYLIVGSESSGTTAIANLLFLEIPSLRFLEEGENQWVWAAYQNIYQKKNRTFDYPRLQLFDAIKVPGFATIIDEFREGFPNSRIIYIVRDPRDFINSAIKTWKINKVADLSTIPWCYENWLDIPNQDPVERLSLRWKKYIQSAMAQKEIIYVRYEDFCTDKVKAIQHLSAQIGIPFNKERVQHLCDLQLCEKSVRNYKPQGPGGWKEGLLEREHLMKIEALCKDEMIYWKYDLEVI